jgi:hypothetical protein
VRDRDSYGCFIFTERPCSSLTQFVSGSLPSRLCKVGSPAKEDKDGPLENLAIPMMCCYLAECQIKSPQSETLLVRHLTRLIPFDLMLPTTLRRMRLLVIAVNMQLK